MSPKTTCHEWISTSPADTMAWGKCLGKQLQAGDVVALYGDLGTGKTALTQGLGSGLGVAGPVVSPTFVLANEYRTASGLYLRHVDCYRLPAANTLLEVENLGLDEWLADMQCVLVIEWADRIQELLPTERITLLLQHGNAPECREIQFWASGSRYVELLEAMKSE